MSAMSASSGLMPLSLISEHKAAQGGPSPVQQLAFAPEKHSLVQAPKPTPNGMEPSPPLVPVVPPAQPEPQPNLPCGGVSETVGEEERSGGVVPEVEPVEPLPPEVPVFADQPPATEPAPPSVAAPSSTAAVPAPAPLQLPSAEPPVSTDPPAPVSLEPPTQEELAASLPEPQPAAALPEPQPEPQVQHEQATEPPVPSAEPQSKPSSDEQPPANSEQSAEPKPSSSQPKPEQAPTPTPAATPAPVGRPSKRTKAAASSASEKKAAPPATPSADTENGDDKRAKRKRLPTQVYQSPIPEENIIAKINKIDKTPSVDDKLIVFYRNEFIAVRNAEGGFYVCQAMQNVYKTSSRIRIRWLSQEENTDLYSPDFYDTTEFDCILTNLNLERIEKNKYRLPDVESQRTQSILKRAIDVENGVAPAEDTTVTEEHPDGLDLSLYRNEDQLKKRKKSNKSKSGKRKTKKVSAEGAKKGTREIPKRNKPSEVKKVNSVSQSQTKRVGRITKVAKPVVQRIVAAKKMGRRKAGPSSSSTSKASPPAAVAKEAPKKKEIPRSAAVKRKSTEPQATPVPEKKQKTVGSAKTRSGVAGGPSGPQQQQPNMRARTSRTTGRNSK